MRKRTQVVCHLLLLASFAIACTDKAPRQTGQADEESKISHGNKLYGSEYLSNAQKGQYQYDPNQVAQVRSNNQYGQAGSYKNNGQDYSNQAPQYAQSNYSNNPPYTSAVFQGNPNYSQYGNAPNYNNGSCAPTCAPSCEPCQSPCWNDCYSDLDGLCYAVIPSAVYRGGSGRSYRCGYESVELFLSAADASCVRSYPFVDLRGHRYGEGRLAANVGLGWRSFSSDFDEMWGANVYYDYRRVKHGNLHQIGVGVELFGETWDIRANGYIPIANKNARVDTRTIKYVGDYVAVRHKFERAMWGLDVEIGQDIFHTKCFDFYAAAGPYYYSDTRNCCSNLIGGMGRIAAYFTDYLTFQGYITYDRIFKTRVQGEIIFSIPLPCSCEWWDNWGCLFERVQRNEIIIADRFCTWDTNF